MMKFYFCYWGKC